MLLLPVIDRDEARFAQASRQMLESVALPESLQNQTQHSGGLIVPKVGGKDRINKPPLIYWVQSLAVGVLTAGDPLADQIWMYRVPSLVAAICTLLILWQAVQARFGRRIALLATLLLAVSPLFAWEARQARADMLLLACTTLAMASLWSLWDGRMRTKFTPAVLWLAITAGVLTKGPVVLLVVGMTALTLSLVTRRWSWLVRTQPLLGLLILMAGVGPWVWAVGEHVGHGVYWQEVFDEVLGRSLEPAEGHSGPPGYHLVLSVVLFWPGAALAGQEFFATIGRLIGTARRKRSPRTKLLFLAAWLIPTWLVMELISTKLPHYVLTVYPALAVLSARAIVIAHRQRLNPGTNLGLRIGIGLWRWLGLALLVMPGIGLAFAFGQWWCVLVSLLLGALWCPPPKPEASSTGNAGWLGMHVRAIVAFAGFALCVPVMLALTPQVHTTKQLMQVLNKHPSTQVAAIGYHEDSLVFGTRGQLQKLNPADQDDYWRAHKNGLLILPTADVLRSHIVLGEAAGFNYSNGKPVELSMVRHFMGESVEIKESAP